MTRRSSFSMLAAALLLVGAPTLGFPNGEGIDSDGCSPCHGSATGTLVVTITGPDTLAPNEVGDYFVSIPATLVGAGVAAEVLDGGSIAPLDAGTQLVSGSIVSHTQRNDGVYGYNVEVTAPGTEGLVTLQAALLAYNDANGSDGDLWNVGTLEIVVPEPSNPLLFLAGLLPLAGSTALRRRTA